MKKNFCGLVFSIAFVAALPAHGAVRSHPSLAYQHHARGVELASKKKWDEALAKFTQAIDLNPAYVASYVEFARTAVMAGRRKEGLKKLDAAFAFARSKEERERITRERDSLSDIFYTNDTFQLYQNGLNYLKLERAGSAIDALEKALKAEPDNVLVLSAYARTLRDQERGREAQEVLERALELNDGRPGVRAELAELMLAQKPERTLSLVKPLLDGDGMSDERTVWIYAQGLSASKRNRDAIEFLRAAYEKQPGWTYAPFWLGKLYASEAKGGWNARKYLMTFLRRTESATASSQETKPESVQLKAARTEAEALLARVNQSLE